MRFDSADEPVYIQTVYGEGYRFIAPVFQPAASPRLPDPEPPKAKPDPPLPVQTKLTTFAGWSLAAVVVVTAIFALVAWRPGKPLRFHEREWIIIAKFENATGEPIFEGSIEAALDQVLSDSRYLNVTPRAR